MVNGRFHLEEHSSLKSLNFIFWVTFMNIYFLRYMYKDMPSYNKGLFSNANMLRLFLFLNEDICYRAHGKVSRKANMCGSRGGTGGLDPPPPPPLKNHKNMGFSRSPEKSQLQSQHLMLSHHQHARETPFKLNGVSLVGR